MTGEQMVALTRRHTLFEWSAQAHVDPIPVARSSGIHFWTPEGKRYIDFNSQLMCVNAGHGDPRIVKAIQEQAATLAYANPFMATEARARLGEKLAQICPGDIDVFFFTNGGAEANENAMRIARLASGRHKILARYRSYHGGTAGSLTMTGDPRRWAMEPGMPGVVHVRHPYHGVQQGSDTAAEALAELEEVMTLEGPQTIAAFILETVTGTNGVLPPPPGYLEGVRALCDKHGILLICDEVMSGFGRTGKWFAVDHYGVVPDILTMAKGLTSAYVPLGAVGIRRGLADHFQQKVFYGGLTYNSHPLGCATALATIQVYEEDNLIQRAAEMGCVMRRLLDDLDGGTSVRRRSAQHRPVRHRRARPRPGDARTDGAVQRHVARDADARAVLPRPGPLHVRAVEHVLHQPAALHHGGRAQGGVRDHRRGAHSRRCGPRVVRPRHGGA